MSQRRSFLPFVALALTACVAKEPPAASPAQLSLFDLVRMAENKETYLDSANPATRVPMSAVVTPPSMEFFFRSPPFAAAASSNTGTKPVLNLQAGLAEGRFAPYVTVEFWTNDYGPVWYVPTYWMVEDDGTGAPVVDPVQKRVVAPLTPAVWTVAPPDRFYTPFWSLYYVLVPKGDVAKLKEHPPKSTADVLNLGYKQIAGPVGTWSVVPDVDVDPSLRPAVDGTTRDPSAGMPAWMKVIARAEYSATNLAKMQTLSVGLNGAFYEGKSINTLFIGVNDFQTLPDYVVKPIPIFVWWDRKANGTLEPARLPSVMGHGTLYANEQVALPGGSPNWSTFWRVYQVIRPASAQPFYPVVPNPDDANETDVFTGARTDHAAPTPSDAVSAIPNVARYAGRVAAKPACFSMTQAELDALTVVAPQSLAATWAKSCQFLDSQTAIETSIQEWNILDSKISALCPMMLWAPVQP